MKRRTFVKSAAAAVPAFAALGLHSPKAAAEMQSIVPPKPEKDGGKSVLAAWFHNCDRERAARVFKLRPEQRVLFAQSVGYAARD